MPSLFEAITQKERIDIHDICEIRSYIETLTNPNWRPSSLTAERRAFPFESTFLESYEDLIKNHVTLERDSIHMTIETTGADKYQVFETEVTLGEERGYIRYLFPLPYVEALIKQLSLLPHDIEVEILYEYSSCIEVDKSHQVSSEPVIALQYPYAEPGFFVLDGNHRVVNAWEKKENKIKAFLLSEEAMTLLAPQPIFYKLYLVHKNLTNIRLYMEESIDLSELKEVYIQLNYEKWRK